jgi:diaminopimelate epimerase
MFEVEFYKMSASGNDFILIDNRDGKVSGPFPDIKDFTVRVCRRNHSVGADGLILIENGQDVDFSWRFYNADGSEAEMCGNGGRCAARFAFLKGIAKSCMIFNTLAGFIKAEVTGASVKLQLTTPTDLKLDYSIQLDDKEIFINSVNTGVPHAVLIVDDVNRVNVEELGRTIRHHKVFGEKGSNVNFVQVIDNKSAAIRTYERGVEGETLACGTGAVAAGIILKTKGLAKSPVNIRTRGGETLKVFPDEEVHLEGSTKIIYVATLHEEALA